MPNSISLASKYASDLDLALVQAAKVGILEDPNFGAKFIDAHTVYLPDISFVGLGDYSKANGYPAGDTTLTHRSYTLAKDRGRQLTLDAMDESESGVQGLAGKMLGEYLRTQVVPEVDAYCLSKLHGVASTNSHSITHTTTTPFADLSTLINSAQEALGYTEDQVIAFVDPKVWTELQTSAEATRYLNIGSFEKGGIETKCTMYNGVPIIPVVKERMRTAYTFNAGATSNAGGFTPDAAATYVKMLVLPRKSASLIKRHEKVRSFSPDVNQDADMWKFDYRLYYDCLVKNSHKDTIFSATTNAY